MVLRFVIETTSSQSDATLDLFTQHFCHLALLCTRQRLGAASCQHLEDPATLHRSPPSRGPEAQHGLAGREVCPWFTNDSTYVGLELPAGFHLLKLDESWAGRGGSEMLKWC